MQTRTGRRPAATDAALAVAVAIAGLAVTVAPGGRFVVDGDRGAPAAFVVVVFAQTVPLLWWRRRPIAVLAAVSAATFVGPLLGAAGSLAALAIAFPLFAVSAARASRVSLPLAVAVIAGDVVYPWLPGVPEDGLNSTELVLSSLAINLGLWIAGTAVRHRRQVAQRRRQQREERARADERARIARELEAVIAHHLCAMVEEAGAGERTLDEHPEQAGESLVRIRHAGSQALTALHRLLGILRAAGVDGSRCPEPTVAELPRLVTHIRQAGLPVRLSVVGLPRTLPPDLDVCAYRVVQEAVGDAARSRGSGRIEIRLAYDAAALAVTVSSGDSSAGTAAPDKPGHRLASIRQRVARCGGRLDEGPGPDGNGRLVHARFPIPEPGPVA